MKILYIIAEGDYDASKFEMQYHGQLVGDLIKQIEGGIPLMDNDEDYDEPVEFSTKIVETGPIDGQFLNFVRGDVQDYDDSKHSNFYLENEIVPK